ncbi:lysM domain receptor-like kinase 3 [Arachis hypogaea]|uniref:lysM domain receptor-like kinase 3 n=1 Tax=Arachis hypogaea TaxID=3818 RepID=UPI003B2119B0
MRAQIALDAARDLEYIHEHTKAHDVHQDITTSNILLDASFRGKISPSLFVAKRNVGEAATRKIATSYGYLAPEELKVWRQIILTDVPLASVMVSILRSTSSLRDNIDLSMMNLYPYDNVFKLKCNTDAPFSRILVNNTPSY